MSDSGMIFRHPFKGIGSPLLKLQQGDGRSVSLASMARPMALKPAASHTSRLPSADDEGIDSELWYACAGPDKTLPPVNSEVAYLPQGHIEQVASFNNQDVDGQIPRYNLPAVIPCILNDIQLSADPETDEVYATLTLCPLSDPVDESSDDVEPLVRAKKKSNMFKKILTVSDTSTHGGFSVPRRSAEECLPPLDKSQDPPTQDLVATDLHGVEWKFRHIFRGQPKRHLLTTGWSIFVSQKRLVAGDSVLFLRGENGQLRIGVRRAPKQQQLQSKVLTSPTMAIGVLAAAAHAATEKSRFSLIYNPRSCPSEFVIPYRKYLSAVKNNFSLGQRFKMRVDSEDAADCKYTGTITGISDYDPERWPNSVWRSLQVNWDGSPSSDRQERLSPWEIGPFTGCTTLPPQAGNRKRPNRLLSQTTFTTDHSLGLSRDGLDSPQSHPLRLGRPLAVGHDSRGMTPPITEEADPDGAVSSKLSWGIKREDGFKTEGFVQNRRSGGDSWLNMRRTDPSPVNEIYRGAQGAGLKEIRDIMSNERRKQEQIKFHVPQFSEQDSGGDVGTSLQLSPFPTFSKSQSFRDADLPFRVSSVAGKDQAGAKSSNLLWPPVSSNQSQPSPGSSFPENGGGCWLSTFRSHPEVSSAVTTKPDCTVLSMNSLPPLESGSSSQPPTPQSNFWDNRGQTEADQTRAALTPHGEQQTCKIFGVPLEKPAATLVCTQTSGLKAVSDELGNTIGNRCGEKLGASVSSGNATPPPGGGSESDKAQRCKGAQNWLQGPVRSYTKVHKQGAIGRSIDVTKFDGYRELIQEIEQMFGLGGELYNKKSGWQLVYTDHEEDVLLVGDDPWVEFCSCVRSIRVLSPGETSPTGRSSGVHLTEAEKSCQTDGVTRKDNSMRCDFQDNSSTSLSTL